MKRLIVIIGLLLATACVTASDGAKYVLDNYLIPVKQPGAMIGRICPAPAEAEIVGNAVRVRAARVPNPAAVRYAWSDHPACANLYNGEGFPADPFRTDAF